MHRFGQTKKVYITNLYMTCKIKVDGKEKDISIENKFKKMKEAYQN